MLSLAIMVVVIVLVVFLQYYFGDANLARDKFLQEERNKDNGWVSLSVLLTFNRLKTLTEDSAVIMTALRKSTNELLEVSCTLIYGSFSVGNSDNVYCD